MVRFLTDGDFDAEIDSEFILVDFYADWCGPCKMLGKVLESIDSVDILKVNVDEHEDLARKYGVMSIPTIIFFSKKQLIKKTVGFLPEDELEKLIQDTKKEIQ